jgi:hypothetical protein
MKAPRKLDDSAIATDAPKGPTVVKAFNTENRRFAVGDSVTREDLSDSLRDFDLLVERGFISLGDK